MIKDTQLFVFWKFTSYKEQKNKFVEFSQFYSLINVSNNFITINWFLILSAVWFIRWIRLKNIKTSIGSSPEIDALI